MATIIEFGRSGQYQAALEMPTRKLAAAVACELANLLGERSFTPSSFTVSRTCSRAGWSSPDGYYVTVRR